MWSLNTENQRTVLPNISRGFSLRKQYLVCQSLLSCCTLPYRFCFLVVKGYVLQLMLCDVITISYGCVLTDNSFTFLLLSQFLFVCVLLYPLLLCWYCFISFVFLLLSACWCFSTSSMIFSFVAVHWLYFNTSFAVLCFILLIPLFGFWKVLYWSSLPHMNSRFSACNLLYLTNSPYFY